MLFPLSSLFIPQNIRTWTLPPFRPLYRRGYGYYINFLKSSRPPTHTPPLHRGGVGRSGPKHSITASKHVSRNAHAAYDPGEMSPNRFDANSSFDHMWYLAHASARFILVLLPY